MYNMKYTHIITHMRIIIGLFIELLRHICQKILSPLYFV